jgi:F-type H+-transporting ATPase subunit b
MPTLLLLLDEGAFTPFSINTGVAFWTVLIFLVLVGLLWRLGWPAILESVEKRERRIQQQLDQAERARAEAAALLEEHRKLLDGAKAEAQEILSRAKAVAEKEREGLLNKARQEYDALLARARKEIDEEKDKALRALRREAVDLSIAAASKLIEARLDTEANRRLVTEYLETIRGQP